MRGSLPRDPSGVDYACAVSDDVDLALMTANAADQPLAMAAAIALAAVI